MSFLILRDFQYNLPMIVKPNIINVKKMPIMKGDERVDGSVRSLGCFLNVPK